MNTKNSCSHGCILIVVSVISCGTKSPTVAITPSIQPTQTIAPTALTSLNNALDLIQEYSYYRKNVDWNAIRNASYQLASGAETPLQTYAAINLVFYTLGDTHGE